MYLQSSLTPSQSLARMPVIPAVSAPTRGPSGATMQVEAVLELARWAPSGDNTQPWLFEVLDAEHVVVHGSDTRDHCVYDLDGRPSQMSIGALIETVAIAATAQGLRVSCSRRPDTPDTHPCFDLRFVSDPTVQRDPLVDAIQPRSVQRRPYSTNGLTALQKSTLEASVAPSHTVRWIEGRSAKLAMAVLLFRSARLRLVTPEAYRVHRDVIEWDAQFSADRVPDRALGVNQAMLNLMRFAMHSWERVQFFNRFLAGTWMPRIQMDFLPAWACGAHFALLSRRPPLGVDESIEAGRAMQRFWLTATHLGLMLQPEMTPLIFARYAREGRAFSASPGAMTAAGEVADRMGRVMGVDAVDRGAFMGRIGHAPAPQSRSLRKDLNVLLRGRSGPA